MGDSLHCWYRRYWSGCMFSHPPHSLQKHKSYQFLFISGIVMVRDVLVPFSFLILSRYLCFGYQLILVPYNSVCFRKKKDLFFFKQLYILQTVRIYHILNKTI